MGYYKAQVDSAKRSLLGVMFIYFSIVRQSYLRQVNIINSTKRQKDSRKYGLADILRTDTLRSVLHHTIDIHRFR